MISVNVYKEGYVSRSDYINILIAITVFENVTDLDLAINDDRRYVTHSILIFMIDIIK